MPDSTRIIQYCSVCKTEYEMSVIPTAYGDEDGVVWLQCPNCKGFLPKISTSADFEKPPVSDDSPPPPAVDVEAPDTAEAPGTDEPEAEDPLIGEPSPVDDIDPESARVYRPWETYETGDVLHHLAWDDYGVVLEKETLPGSRKVVKVRFVDSGVVRLIEDDGTGS